MAFSKAFRVMMSRGQMFLRTSSMTWRPHSRPTSGLSGWVAGTLALPMGEIPSISNAMAMVLAVNWPPQAPAPGQAWSSMSFSSRSVILPDAWAPTASKTSWMVTSCCWKLPGMMDPP